MCVIVDANVAADVFVHRLPDFKALLKWVEDGDGKLVFGGRLAAELSKVSSVCNLLTELHRNGRAIRKSDAAVMAEERTVMAMALCGSNDAHVIALARVSGARVLCSHDKKLHADFKNKKLVPNPRGRVYQSNHHARVLHHDPGCGSS